MTQGIPGCHIRVIAVFPIVSNLVCRARYIYVRLTEVIFRLLPSHDNGVGRQKTSHDRNRYVRAMMHVCAATAASASYAHSYRMFAPKTVQSKINKKICNLVLL